MRTTSLLSIAAIVLATTAIAKRTQPVDYQPSITWCNDQCNFEGKCAGPCVSELQVPADGACRLIPDSNAKGDAGSSVTLGGVREDGDFCMTLYFNNDCTKRAKNVYGDWLEFPLGQSRFDPPKNGIYRAYKLIDSWDNEKKINLRCTGHSFDSEKDRF